MIIKVRVDNVEISIEETLKDADKHVTMRWPDQNKQIQETIKVIAGECIKLRSVLVSNNVRPHDTEA
jgi:hypothetical protein